MESVRVNFDKTLGLIVRDEHRLIEQKFLEVKPLQGPLCLVLHLKFRYKRQGHG